MEDEFDRLDCDGIPNTNPLKAEPRDTPLSFDQLVRGTQRNQRHAQRARSG